MLTQRLRDLEAATVLRRRGLGPPASTWVYELTGDRAAVETLLGAIRTS